MRTRDKVAPPRQYNVIFHNDDVTTMDFVVYVLETVFSKSRSVAVVLMLKVHNEGSAIVATYSLDIARSKADQATKMARDAGFPLRITCEPEDSIPF